MIRLERRPNPSQVWSYLTPVVALIATMIAGGAMFAALGSDPVEAIRLIFWDPLFGEFAFYYRAQILVKAGPL
ncbi:MAG: ABC transporter permease, partial [Pseudomonadota bacterium]